MHSPGVSFAELRPGDDLGRLAVTVSAAANERYWAAAGVDHPALRGGLLYPPIAANLTVLLFGGVCPDPVIQTRQHLRSHRAQEAGVELVATGTILDCYEKRGRRYVDLRATVVADAELLWTSEVSFTPAATLGATR
jgi:hypothetical protein